MTALVPVLAHEGGSGSAWLGIATVAAVAVAVLFVLAVLDRVQLDGAGDLLLPLAAVVLVAGLGGSLGDAVADRAPIAVPVLVVLGVAVVVAASTDLVLRPTSPLAVGAVVLAVVAAVVAGPWLEQQFFPAPEALPTAQDAVVDLAVVEGPDAQGVVRVEVSVSGGSLGVAVATERPDDLEEGMLPRFVAGPAFVLPLDQPTDCDPTCTSATYGLQLPEVDGGLPDRVTVELLTAHQLPFAPPVRATVDLP